MNAIINYLEPQMKNLAVIIDATPNKVSASKANDIKPEDELDAASDEAAPEDVGDDEG